MCCILTVNLARADLLVDTGQPDDVLSGSTLWQSQWLAGEFTLNQASTITDVEGWMYQQEAGNLTVAIYGDGGNVPDTSSELYTSLADPGQHRVNTWVGAHGLSWDLSPGTYWAAFEVRNPSTADYRMPFANTPSPLDHYAWSNGSSWNNQDDMDLGIRIYASPVPGPGAAILGFIGMGTAATVLRRRRKKVAA